MGPSFILNNGASSDGPLDYFFILMVVYLLGQFLRFYGTLFLGVSLGQFLMGLRGASSFLWNRVGGVGRVFIETFFGPFLIFDFPLLKGGSSFKEKLSMTRLIEFKEGAFQKLRYLLILPPFIILSFFAPLLQDLTLIDGILVSFSKEKSEKISNKTNFESYKHYPSNRFKLNSFSSLRDGRFLILPSFQVTKKGKTKKMTPYFIIYDTKNSSDGYFKAIGTVPLMGLMSFGKKGNPFFSFKYPELDKALGEKRTLYEKRNYTDQSHKKTLINQLAKAEIKELIQSSFELSYKSLGQHLLNNGPFIRGHVEVRNKLLKLVPKNPIPEVDLIQMGSHKFLRFKQKFLKKRVGQKPYVETLLPITSQNALVYEFGWDKTMRDAFSRKAFRESFFGVVDWYFDYKSVFKFPKNKDDFKSIQILDYFTKNNLSVIEQSLLEKYIDQYYSKVSKMALSKNDDKLKEILISCLNRLFLVGKIKNRAQGKFSQEFFKKISYLKQTLVETQKHVQVKREE